MDSTTWKRAKQVFHEALEKGGPERSGLVAAACGEDEQLRAQVQALLKAHDEAGEFLASPTVPEADEAARAVRVSFSLMPLFSPHTLLDDEELLQGLANPILEGVRLARSTPGIEPVVVARGQAEVDDRLGRNAEALAAYDRFLELGGRAVEAECRYAQARLHHREGRYEESLDLLERVAQIDENGNWGIGALRLLGVAHAEIGDHESAIDALRRFRAKRPEALAPLILLADGLRRAGNEEEAGRFYLVAVRRFPEAPLAYRRLISYLERTRQYDEALKYARRLRERLPHDESAEALVQRLRARAD